MSDSVDGPLVQSVFEIFGVKGKKELGPYVCKLLTSEQDKPGTNEKYPAPIDLFNTDKNFKAFVKQRAQLMKSLPKPDVESCLINICRFSRKPKNDKNFRRFSPFHYWVQEHAATIQAKKMPTVAVRGPAPLDDDYDWDKTLPSANRANQVAAPPENKLSPEELERWLRMNDEWDNYPEHLKEQLQLRKKGLPVVTIDHEEELHENDEQVENDNGVGLNNDAYNDWLKEHLARKAPPVKETSPSKKNTQESDLDDELNLNAWIEARYGKP